MLSTRTVSLAVMALGTMVVSVFANPLPSTSPKTEGPPSVSSFEPLVYAPDGYLSDESESLNSPSARNAENQVNLFFCPNHQKDTLCQSQALQLSGDDGTCYGMPAGFLNSGQSMFNNDFVCQIYQNDNCQPDTDHHSPWSHNWVKINDDTKLTWKSYKCQLNKPVARTVDATDQPFTISDDSRDASNIERSASTEYDAVFCHGADINNDCVTHAYIDNFPQYGCFDMPSEYFRKGDSLHAHGFYCAICLKDACQATDTTSGHAWDVPWFTGSVTITDDAQDTDVWRSYQCQLNKP